MGENSEVPVAAANKEVAATIENVSTAADDQLTKVEKVLEAFISKFISKKLMVMVAGTVLLISGHISSDQWMSLSLGFVGVEGFSDIVTRFKTGTTSSGK